LVNARYVQTGADVNELYKRAPFYYQFFKPSHLSRVMVCDTDGELAWLAQNVDEGARIQTLYLDELQPRIEYTLLNGERIKSADKLRELLQRGPFTYQVRANGLVAPIAQCDSAENVDFLAALLTSKYDIVIRQ
jgi:hypothetical protein